MYVVLIKTTCKTQMRKVLRSDIRDARVNIVDRQEYVHILE